MSGGSAASGTLFIPDSVVFRRTVALILTAGPGRFAVVGTIDMIRSYWQSMFGSDRVSGWRAGQTDRFNSNMMQHGANTCSMAFTAGLTVSKQRKHRPPCSTRAGQLDQGPLSGSTPHQPLRPQNHRWKLKLLPKHSELTAASWFTCCCRNQRRSDGLKPARSSSRASTNRQTQEFLSVI